MNYHSKHDEEYRLQLEREVRARADYLNLVYQLNSQAGMNRESLFPHVQGTSSLDSQGVSEGAELKLITEKPDSYVHHIPKFEEWLHEETRSIGSER